MKPSATLTRLAICSLFCLAGLSACTTLPADPNQTPQQALRSKRSVMTVAEIESSLLSGMTSPEIIAALSRRGSEPIGSEDIELLRKAGASHGLINRLIEVNQPDQYVWVAPPRFSVFFGRSGWYWVDSFGWPVYPQPHSNWYRQYPQHQVVPIKPSPKKSEKPETTRNDAERVEVKPSPKVDQKPVDQKPVERRPGVVEK